MVLGKIISSKGYTFGQKWIISMIFRSFFITCIHKYGPNSPCASKMISIFMIFYYLYGIFWYCEVRSVGSLTLIKSRFGRGVPCLLKLIGCTFYKKKEVNNIPDFAFYNSLDQQLVGFGQIWPQKSTSYV